MARRLIDLGSSTHAASGVDEFATIDAVQGAFGELAGWYYVPRAELIYRGDVLASGAEAVAMAVQGLFEDAYEIEITVAGDVVTVTAKLRHSALLAEFHIRFGLIGTVRATSMQVVDGRYDASDGG